MIKLAAALVAAALTLAFPGIAPAAMPCTPSAAWPSRFCLDKPEFRMYAPVATRSGR